MFTFFMFTFLFLLFSENNSQKIESYLDFNNLSKKMSETSELINYQEWFDKFVRVWKEVYR